MKTTIIKKTLVATLAALTASAYAGDLHVPTNYATIQAAVDAANSGDTIHIAPGVYVEQTAIRHKDLTLMGQPGTILRAFPGMAPRSPGSDKWRCIVNIQFSANVAIKNLTFEGEQLAEQNPGGFVGALFLDAGGSVEDCRFTGFREQNPGTNGAWAVIFWNDLPGASMKQMRVVGNTVADSYIGIDFVGAPDVISLDVTVTENTITGIGPSTAEANMRGIFVGEGAVGNVTRNTISGFSNSSEPTDEPPLLAFGILGIGKGFPTNVASLSPMSFEGNVLRSNQVHFGLVLGHNSTIDNNTFEGTAPGERPTGLWISGENVQATGNLFRDLPVGIEVAGEDPDFGTILGIATNAMLIANRFCNVDTNITLQPLATATETGTLTCPFPEPELDIAKSVLLSWPGIEEGFVVESAPAPEGPWTGVKAAAFLQDGNHGVSVPTDSDQKYFRLAKP